MSHVKLESAWHPEQRCTGVDVTCNRGHQTNRLEILRYGADMASLADPALATLEWRRRERAAPARHIPGDGIANRHAFRRFEGNPQGSARRDRGHRRPLYVGREQSLRDRGALPFGDTRWQR